jgi:hypothetical protein
MIPGPTTSPTWRRWEDIPRVCLHPRNLRWTLSLTLVVGTILFAINQLDVVLSGGANPRVWLKTGLTFLVPFLVSNCGILLGSRQRTH